MDYILGILKDYPAETVGLILIVLIINILRVKRQKPKKKKPRGKK